MDLEDDETPKNSVHTPDIQSGVGFIPDGNSYRFKKKVGKTNKRQGRSPHAKPMKNLESSFAYE